MINVKKYLICASLGAMMLGSDAKGENYTGPTFGKMPSVEEKTKKSKKIQSEQEKFWKLISRRKDFKSLPKEIKKLVTPDRIEIHHSDTSDYSWCEVTMDSKYELMYSPHEPQDAIKLIVWRTGISSEDFLPQYPVNEKFADETAAQSYFILDEALLTDLTAEQKEFVTGLHRQMNAVFHRLYTEPFAKIDMKKLMNGDYMGKVMPFHRPWLIDLTGQRSSSAEDEFKRKEGPIQGEINDYLGRPLSYDEWFEYAPRVDTYGSCIDQGNARMWGKANLFYISRVGKISKPHAESIRKTFISYERQLNLESFDLFKDRLEQLIKKHDIDIKDVKNLNSSKLQPFHKAVLNLYAQGIEKIDKCMKFLKPAKEIKGAVCDYVTFDGLSKQNRYNHSTGLILRQR